MNGNLYMFDALMLHRVCRHVYNTDIITVDQGRCIKWGIKLTKELANPRCLSYSIRNLAGMEMRLRDEGGGDGSGDGGGGGGEVFGGRVFGGSVVLSGDGEVDVVRRRSVMEEVSTLSSKNWYGVVKLESWSQRERQFCQFDMTRNDDLVGVRVKEPISTMIVRVPKKDRWCGTRGK
nr:hypothetical protein [Tanacetum cinerariifolium]